MRLWRTWSVLSAVVLTACAVGEELAFIGDTLPSTGGAAGATSGPNRDDAAGAANSSGGASATTGPGGANRDEGGGAGAVAGGGPDMGDSGEVGKDRADRESDAAAAIDRTSTDALVAVDSPSGCVPTQKACADRCVLPGPGVGCTLTGCTPCPAPLHATARCAGVECDFDCDPSYVRSGASCVAGGGSDGPDARDANIGDGRSSTCTPMQCGGCIPVIQAPCCKSVDTCGCQYPFAPCM